RAAAPPDATDSDPAQTIRSQLEALALELDTPFPGTLVFNPSPVERTDVAWMADGTEQVVTDVPGLGYAFVVEQAGGAASAFAIDPPQPMVE
ncbi:MAG: hypothetical protein GWN71_26420, partial [Gammaproteobacteria bacterium]|nr:hypothetical protein [Gemmatimonadota bacterium]NIR34541.1 hypothetical protein [Actinomycetota bacterium]NIU76961.1 hypothetical protein [Gammaproteobacteria bacterium]NIX18387.1 hypothetical protein [Actinomycetota bacterium]